MAELDLDVTALARLVENAKVDAPLAYANLSRWLVARRELILAALERAERVEAAAREAAFCRRPEAVRDNRAPEGWGTVDCGECSGCKLSAALADVPGRDRDEERDLLELAWGLIANAGEGDWEREHPGWRETAVRWRERYHAVLRSWPKKPAVTDQEMPPPAAEHEPDPALAEIARDQAHEAAAIGTEEGIGG